MVGNGCLFLSGTQRAPLKKPKQVRNELYLHVTAGRSPRSWIFSYLLPSCNSWLPLVVTEADSTPFGLKLLLKCLCLLSSAVTHLNPLLIFISSTNHHPLLLNYLYWLPSAVNRSATEYSSSSCAYSTCTLPRCCLSLSPVHRLASVLQRQGEKNGSR